jgi:flagellar P-ring protein FlgI
MSQFFNRNVTFLLLSFFFAYFLLFNCSYASRLKDIADIEGVRVNQLVGYGIVVGLNGTGDGNNSQFTTKSLSNMLENLGIRIDPINIQVKNVAAVLVTANLPPFSRPGSRIDVTLSSLGDAKSLVGGTLLFTPLKGADNNVYAIAQGPISVGGFSIEGEGDSAQKNHPTVGVISQGATVERAISFDLFKSDFINVVLREPDFTTMSKLVNSVNRAFGTNIAQAVSASTLRVGLSSQIEDAVSFVAFLEQVEIEQDIIARVVVNEKSGTVVIGDAVRVSRVALAHGNLSIAIKADNQISQPNPLSPQGETAGVTNSDINVAEEEKRLSLLGGEVTLGDVVEALNALGATPRDLISIFMALKKSGALQAEIIIM